jgi:hypothetical protein
MGWGTFLLALAGPLAKQVLIALGFSIATYTGVSIAVDALLSQAKANWAGTFSADVANLIAMAGANTALSILAGALIGRVSMMAMKRLIPK